MVFRIYWIWFFWTSGFGSSGLLDLVLLDSGFGSSGLLDLVLLDLLDLVLLDLLDLVLRIYWTLGFLRLDIVAIINDDTKIVNKIAGL